MEDQTKERWYQLCALAAVENDPQKLLALVAEVNHLLDLKDQSKRKGMENAEWIRTANDSRAKVAGAQLLTS